MNQTTKAIPVQDAGIDWYLQAVYQALLEKGYSPVDQIAGYLLTGDPTYITNHHHARCLAAHIDREQLIRRALKKYLESIHCME